MSLFTNIALWSSIILLCSCKTTQRHDISNLASVQVRAPQDVEFDNINITFENDKAKYERKSVSEAVSIPYGTYRILIALFKEEQETYRSCDPNQQYIFDEPIENPLVRLCRPDSETVVSTLNAIPDQSSVIVDIEIDNTAKEKHGDIAFAKGSPCTALNPISKNDEGIFKISLSETFGTRELAPSQAIELCTFFLPIQTSAQEMVSDLSLSGTMGLTFALNRGLDFDFQVLLGEHVIRSARKYLQEEVSIFNFTTNINLETLMKLGPAPLCSAQKDIKVALKLVNRGADPISLSDINLPQFTITGLQGNKLACSNELFQPMLVNLCQQHQSDAQLKLCEICVQNNPFDSPKVEECIAAIQTQ